MLSILIVDKVLSFSITRTYARVCIYYQSYSMSPGYRVTLKIPQVHYRLLLITFNITSSILEKSILVVRSYDILILGQNILPLKLVENIPSLAHIHIK